ncbi:putative alpha-amylase [Ceraceosorus guamensis]|uniref:Putative alpha-amylase n=1 Tax=Ceraceosorus guamensis TaxID=1522189 RepID=A0A316VQW1_9BASI|nr:putative alpha-amylase [Ceraceosorus guamensis]PWN39604.1 putative alpha-amylase [Ceraceosorus guamensis]
MSSAANKHHSEAAHAPVMLQGFEWNTPAGGNHWQWLRDNAARFAAMGITAIWIPPATKGGNQDGTGYDIYDMWDLGEFEKKPGEGDGTRTKYGTRQQLEECIGALKQHHIVVYMDLVWNHKDGADGTENFKAIKVDSENRSKDISEPIEIEGWTSFTFPGRQAKHSGFQWSFNHFTGVDYDNKSGDKSIYRIVGEGKDWADDVDEEKGGFDFLLGADIDHAHPDVREEFTRYAKWLVRTFPIAGMRFDAVKHFSRTFLASMVKIMREEARHVRKEAGKEPFEETDGPCLFAVGELWKDSIETIVHYVTNFEGEQMSLFDAPLHYNFKEASDAAENFDLRKVLDGTMMQKRPIDAVTLVENHDTQPGQSLASPISATFKPLAYALILLRAEGYPCVFLGDLDGCHAEGDSQPSVPKMNDLDKFIKARKYFGAGEQREYWDHPNCIGWVRTGAGENGGCAVVLCNGSGDGEKRMEIGKVRF